MPPNDRVMCTLHHTANLLNALKGNLIRTWTKVDFYSQQQRTRCSQRESFASGGMHSLFHCVPLVLQ